MAETVVKPRRELTSLLDNELLARLGRMRIQAIRRRTNRAQGEHLAGKGGASTEFADYRDYVPGDDMRFVDWNIFFRLHRPYVKLFRLEEVMHVVILVDGSTSMQFDDKFLRAKQLAAAFGVMGLMAMERVSVYICHEQAQVPVRFTPTTGRASMARLFQFLESQQGGGSCPFDVAIERVLQRHTGRGVVVMLSDFLTFGNMERAFNLLYSTGLEPYGIQILAPSEILPDIDGDLRFVDSETGAHLDITSASDLLTIYQEHRVAYEMRLAAACRQRNGRFALVSTDQPVRHVLLDQLLRQGWMR